MSGFMLVDIEGDTLTTEDRELLQHPAVAGIILFSRNYQNPKQLLALTSAIKKIRETPLLILVDQEGGRVQRFKEGFTQLPSMQYWGECYERDPDQVEQALRQTIHTLIKELKAVGIPISLMPVLDVDHGVSKVIGERSFANDPNIVIKLAKLVIDSMHELGMPATGKHFPGHGGVAVDSHMALPIDQRSRETIIECDLRPFAALIHCLDAIMPAHVVYKAFDDKPAAFSPYWLQQVLRKELKFNGLIMSDDLTMQGAAEMGDYPARAKKALLAGCDLISVCNNRSGVEVVLQKMGEYHSSSSQQNLKNFIRKIV